MRESHKMEQTMFSSKIQLQLFLILKMRNKYLFPKNFIGMHPNYYESIKIEAYL